MVFSSGCAAGACAKQGVANSASSRAGVNLRFLRMVPPGRGTGFRTAYLTQEGDEFYEGGCNFRVSRWRLPTLKPFDRVPRPKRKLLLREKDMAISQELLAILACPVCKTPVKLTPDNSRLKFQTCNRDYPIPVEVTEMILDLYTIA